MIVSLQQILADGAAVEARAAERRAKRTGVRPAPLTVQERADALVAKREARDDRARRRAARQAAGKHRKACR